MWLLEHGPVATPHAQRIRAEIEVEFQDVNDTPGPAELIVTLEKAVGTPVQATVKRIDEQEFARLNAENLMFCEDAARRLKGALDEDLRISDFLVRVEHQESLHAHNAVAIVRKVPACS